VEKHINIEGVSFVTGILEGSTYQSIQNHSVCENWFDPTKYLGKKGYKYYSEPVKYALAACNSLTLCNAVDETKRGVFIGSNSMDLNIREQVLNHIDAQDMIGAPLAPNGSANIATGILAQKYSFKGPGYTFTGPEDSALMALWQAHKCLKSGEIHTAIVGQVEHNRYKQKSSGAILWLLSVNSEKKGLQIDNLFRKRWVPELGLLPNIQLTDFNSKVYIIGHNSKVLTLLTEKLERSGQCYSRIWYEYVDQALCQDLHLYSMLSLLALKKVCGVVFIVSSNGHIFNFKLEK
jgi:hypothetical protein